MKRRIAHPPGDPVESARSSDFYAASKPVDSYFICPHGVDKCEKRCDECEAELHAAMCENPLCACNEERAERKAAQIVDEHKDGLR